MASNGTPRKSAKYANPSNSTTRYFSDNFEGGVSSNEFYQDGQAILPPSQLAGAVPGFDGLGITEAKVGDVLFELHKFRLELAQGIAQDLAAHHKSIVDEMKTFITEMFSRVAIGEVALTEPTPEIAVTRGDDPGIEKSTAVDGNEKASVRRGLGQRESAEETVSIMNLYRLHNSSGNQAITEREHRRTW